MAVFGGFHAAFLQCYISIFIIEICNTYVSFNTYILFLRPHFLSSFFQSLKEMLQEEGLALYETIC